MIFWKGSAISSATISKATVANPPSRSAERFRLLGPSIARDPRITAARRDIADIALADRLFAPHYARSEPYRCHGRAAMLHATPRADATAISQILPGEEFRVLDISAGWAWGYCALDGYVGYVTETALALIVADPTHVVKSSGAPIFAQADIKAPVATILPVGSRVAGTVDGEFFALTDGGYLHHRHIMPLDHIDPDPVAIACALVGMPYLWGGRGGGGIDCSGLVQLTLARAGIAVPRDSDQQRDAIGSALPDDVPPARGDILFFPGHVGLMVDPVRLVHANANAMAVTIEPLTDVVARVAADHPQPILARRRLA